MPTNIGSITLGDLVLGSSQSNVINRTVTSTITFTQLISKTIEALNQTITFTQDIEYTRAYNRTVTSTLTLAQVVKAPGYFTVTSTLALAQDIDEEHGKIRSLPQSIGLSQTVSGSHVANKLIVQGLNWAHTRAYNANYARTVPETLTLTQTIHADYIKKVDSTLGLTQLVSFEKLKHVEHHIELGQAIVNLTNYTRRINTQYPVFQIIDRSVKFNKTISVTLNLTQTITQARVKGVSQNLTLTQIVDGFVARNVTNNLIFSQSFNYNLSNNREVTQILNLDQEIGLVRSRVAHVHHGFGLNSIVKQHREFNKTVNQSLSFGQTVAKETHIGLVGQTLTFGQTVTVTPIYPRVVTNNLVLGQEILLTRVINASVQNTLTFLPIRQVYVGMGDVQYYTIENVQYSLIKNYQKVKPHCVLQTNNAAITMPSPNFSDTEAYGGVFTIRRSMNGIPYTHVRSLSLRKLKLPWTLAKRKAWELREFLIQNNAKLITLTTWKGDKWFVNLVTNPFELAIRGRYDAENEKVDVELEFEGLKVM